MEEGELAKKVAEVGEALASLPPGSMRDSKRILREGMGATELHAANKRECELLRERWVSDECMGAIMAFLTKGAAEKKPKA